MGVPFRSVTNKKDAMALRFKAERITFMKFIASIIHKIKKLSILDWFIIAGVCVVFGFVLYNRVTKKEEWIWIKLNISDNTSWSQGSPPPYWYAQGLTKGQSAYNSFGQKIAEAGSIENYDMGGTNRLIYMDIKLLVSYDKRQHIYLYNYQPLQIGNQIDLTFNQYNVRGIVTYIGSNKIQYQDKEIEVKLLNEFQWSADSYKEGLRMTDMSGTTVAQILSVSTTDTTVSQLTDSDGRMILISNPDPSRKEVTIRLKIKTFTFAGASYFIDGAAIKIGENIWFQFQNTAIKSAIITRIY
jgi:hypothetical protein